MDVGDASTSGDHQRPLADPQSWERGQKQVLLQSLRMKQLCRHLPLELCTFLLLKAQPPLVCGPLLLAAPGDYAPPTCFPEGCPTPTDPCGKT